MVWGQPRQKAHENPSQQVVGHNVVHQSSQAMWDTEIGRIMVLSLGEGKGVCKTPSQWKKAECGGRRLSSQLPQEAWNGRMEVQTSLDKKWDPIFKITTELEVWLKLQSACLAKVKPWVQTPLSLPPQKRVIFSVVFNGLKNNPQDAFSFLKGHHYQKGCHLCLTISPEVKKTERKNRSC
jgi:hypothetical protein